MWIPALKSAKSIAPELAAGFALLLCIAAAVVWIVPAPVGLLWISAVIYGVLALLVGAGWKLSMSDRRFGWANRVTLARVVLVSLLAAGLLMPDFYPRHTPLIAGVAAIVVVLDGLDGWLARRFHDASRFGARFDMEIDALLVLVLSIGVVMIGKAGAWVLAIGLMRYAFLLAGRVFSWLRAELPESRARKTICVVQAVVLCVALLPGVNRDAAASLLAIALSLLVASFGRDVVWLHRQRTPLPRL
jgi:phosphatidylglycerophosphate synthase